MEQTQKEEETIESQQQQHHLQPAAAPDDPKGTTFLRTCLNGLNALSGVGILSIPYALSEGGWLSLILVAVMAITCCYTGLLLKRCMDVHPSIRTYPDIGELAFGWKGRLVISVFLYLELYLVSVEFLILEGDNLDKLFPNTINIQLKGLKISGKHCFTLLATIVIMPTTWLRSLGVFAYVSAGGILASVVVVGCVFWVGAVNGVGFHEQGKVWNWSGLPTSVSLYAFCYCGHAVFPTLCTSMKDKNQFPKVLVICFLLCTLNYGSMAIVGYLMYGEGLKSQVTLNLPLGKLSSKIAIYTTLINPLTKYAIMITPIVGAIEDRFPLCNKNRPIDLLIRTAIVISTVLVALTVPLFGYLMAFIGAFLSVAGSILLPCICYLKISHVNRFGFEFVIIVIILCTGSLVGVLGTYSSLRQIIAHLTL